MKKKLLSLVLALMMILSVFSEIPINAVSTEKTSGYYTYTLSNNQATITNVVASISGAVVVPSSLDGYTVVGIRGYSFQNLKGIKSVTIPDSITTIGDYAFSGCSSITSVTIGNGVNIIPYRGFNGCTSLETLIIGSNVTEIKGSAFIECTALNSITWGSSLKIIGDHAFKGCVSITSLNIPDTVTTIKDSAFSGFSGITSLTISNNVTSIGAHTFEDCTELNSVTIPCKVTTIGGSAFEDCNNLKTVYLPESLQQIDYYGFGRCNNITDVYYEGSSIDWLEIEFDNGNDSIKNANIHYKYVLNTDTEKPAVSISSTNNIDTKQTVKLSLSDNVGVVSYYWGTNSMPSDSAFTEIASTTNTSITKTVSNAGTYYLLAKDAAGNVSVKESVTFLKTTFNGNNGSVSPSYVITKNGKSFSLPSATRSGYTFLGWAESSSASSTKYSANSSYTVNESDTLYAVWKENPAPVVLEAVSIHSMPSKTEYDIGEELDTAGLVLLLTYSDNSTATASTGFTVSGFSSSSTGTKTVTVTYQGCSTTFTVRVVDTSVIVPIEPSLSSISVNTLPSKTVYSIGEALNTAGLTIKLTYSDNSTDTVSDGFTVSGFSSSKAGTKTGPVTYKGKTTTFNVTVTEPVPETDALIAVSSAKGIAGNQQKDYCAWRQAW